MRFTEKAMTIQRADRTIFYAQRLLANLPDMRTHLVYGANLGYTRGKQILDKVVAWGLAEPCLDIGGVWKITDKGLRFLAIWHELEKLMDE